MWSSISCADIEDLHERCLAPNYNSSGARPTTYTKKRCIKVLFHSIESQTKRLDLGTLKPDRSRVRRTKAPSHTYTTITNIQMTLINHLEHPQTDSVLSCALNQRHQWHQVIAPKRSPRAWRFRFQPKADSDSHPAVSHSNLSRNSLPQSTTILRRPSTQDREKCRLSPIICQINPLTATQCETSF